MKHWAMLLSHLKICCLSTKTFSKYSLSTTLDKIIF